MHFHISFGLINFESFIMWKHILGLHGDEITLLPKFEFHFWILVPEKCANQIMKPYTWLVLWKKSRKMHIWYALRPEAKKSKTFLLLPFSWFVIGWFSWWECLLLFQVFWIYISCLRSFSFDAEVFRAAQWGWALCLGNGYIFGIISSILFYLPRNVARKKRIFSDSTWLEKREYFARIGFGVIRLIVIFVTWKLSLCLVHILYLCFNSNHYCCHYCWDFEEQWTGYWKE